MNDYMDYKAHLKSRIARGTQKRLATYIGCQPAFLSQVLHGKPHLSLEQGLLASEYFKMTSAEQEYFMLALQMGRAGSARLGKFFLAKMNALQARGQRVDAQIGSFEELDVSTKATYYSSWKYAVVHILLTLPTPTQHLLLKTATKLSDQEIENILSFLQRAGLANCRSGKWLPTKRRVHLNPEDPLIGAHHKNFRTLTLGALEDLKQDSIHYSSVLAIAEADCAKIKNVLLEAIARTEAILKPSPEETMRVFSMDFFEP